MLGIQKRFMRYLLPLLTSLLLIVLLVVALFRLSAVQREMRSHINTNMVWVIYYAHLESLRLNDVIQKKALQPEAKVNPLLRYQMLLSRLHLLHDGPQLRFLEKIELLDELNTQTEAIKQLAPFLLSLDLTAQQIAQIQTTLSEFSTLMLRASSQAMTAQWEELGAGMDMNRNAVLAIISIMVGILVCSVFISIQLLMALRQSRENERVKQQKIELIKQLENERKTRELYRSFGAMVSHQFRTPLAIIDASMQRLIRASHRMTPAEVAHRATKAKDATERLTHLIESILSADRFMAQVDLHLQRFSLLELVQQLLASHPFSSTQRRVHFTYDQSADFMLVGDPVLVREILVNLLSNADKYSPLAQPIDMRIYAQDAWLCCEVKDQGRGIAAAELDHIFQRYFRSEKVTDVVGTGIGLYVAAELARLLQAQLCVDSTEGQGSVFTLCLGRDHD